MRKLWATRSHSGEAFENWPVDLPHAALAGDADNRLAIPRLNVALIAISTKCYKSSCPQISSEDLRRTENHNETGTLWCDTPCRRRSGKRYFRLQLPDSLSGS